MGCSTCGGGKPQAAPNVKYAVLDRQGKEVDEADTEPEARIKAIHIGGRVVIRKKSK